MLLKICMQGFLRSDFFGHSINSNKSALFFDSKLTKKKSFSQHLEKKCQLNKNNSKIG